MIDDITLCGRNPVLSRVLCKSVDLDGLRLCARVTEHSRN